MSIPMIAGLYPYTRSGVSHPPVVTLSEIPQSLTINPLYRERLIVLAGDRTSAEHLQRFGLSVRRTFDDAPAWVHHDAAHKMKHWMCRWALDEFGGFVWVDWDTVCLQEPTELCTWAEASKTPRFISIPDYWATVNCGVYSAPSGWASAMDDSFHADVSEPNDELLWASVLPDDVQARSEFWWGDRVVHVERRGDISLIGEETVFAHVKRLAWADALRKRWLSCLHRKHSPVCAA